MNLNHQFLNGISSLEAIWIPSLASIYNRVNSRVIDFWSDCVKYSAVRYNSSGFVLEHQHLFLPLSCNHSLRIKFRVIPFIKYRLNLFLPMVKSNFRAAFEYMNEYGFVNWFGGLHQCRSANFHVILLPEFWFHVVDCKGKAFTLTRQIFQRTFHFEEKSWVHEKFVRVNQSTGKKMSWYSKGCIQHWESGWANQSRKNRSVVLVP